MQLVPKHSLLTATLLFALQAQAEDYVSIQYLQYDEADNRTSVSAPSVTIEKDFGLDYTINIHGVIDAVSGASPSFYDTRSGASAFSRGQDIASDNIKYGNVAYSEGRRAGGGSITVRMENRDELTLGENYSGESDFYSYESSIAYLHFLGEAKNQMLGFGGSYQSNEILVECSYNGVCSDANSAITRSGASEKMTNSVMSGELSFRQNINRDSYLKIALFMSRDSGYLSNPYLNIVQDFDGLNADIVAERRPETKSANGVALKYANAFSEAWIGKLDYRYYSDDWGVTSQTINTQLLYALNDDYSLRLGVRHYAQEAADFYGGELNSFKMSDTFASSDHRLAKYSSILLKSGFDVKVSESFTYNLDLASYKQSASTQGKKLEALYLVTGLKYTF